MSPVRPKTRLIVTASLLLCVPLASFYPRVNTAEAREVAAAANQGQKLCCCGTTDGRCCGMACCQLPNPKNDKAPSAPNRSDERHQPLGFTVASDASLSGSAHIAFRGLIESDAGSTNSTSLISLSIRLNV